MNKNHPDQQKMSPATLAKYIDHTLLKPESALSDIEKLCSEADRYGFYSVCVNSCFVSTCKKLLKNPSVKITSVVGFPLGAMATAAKAYETTIAIADGADEIDMVLNIGYLKSGSLDLVEKDIRAVVQAAQGRPVKVILETFLLNETEKTLACQLSKNAGALFVKTCTGFGGGQATIEDVKLMKKNISQSMFVKASGGIKTTDQAFALLAAGADRLGTSSGVALVSGTNAASGSY